MGGACSTHERDKMHITFRLENLKGRDHSENLGVGRRITLEWILGKEDGEVWTGLIWIRIRTNGGSL
jgi:hypothetical protein